MAYETIVTARDGDVAVLSFNRPKVLNAFNGRLIAEVGEAMAELGRDEAVRAIVVRGEGRAFSAGFDLKESVEREVENSEQWRAILQDDFDFIMQFWDCPKPTIAAVHGYCLAGAFELALACDVTVAAEGTKFGEPEVRFGSGIIAMLLPWITGPKQAKELLLTGNDRLDAREALAMGIINHVVPLGGELTKAMAIARDMAAASPLSVRLTKRQINRSYEIMGLRQALLANVDADVLIEATPTPDKLEFKRLRAEQGLKAAIAWRDARFAKPQGPV